MTAQSDIFKKNVEEYQRQLAEVDFASIRDRLGIEMDSGKMFIPFFKDRFFVSRDGITDASDNPPDYRISVILSKYILLCPDETHHDSEWTSFKDFKRVSHFTNVNFFSSDTERVIEKHFSGKMRELQNACDQWGGLHHEMETPYDISMQFQALPRISLLLLFNDGDEEFPARCTVLFQKHAEYYLDPESLAITSAWLPGSLKQVMVQ
jgi:hypothetical protein